MISTSEPPKTSEIVEVYKQFLERLAPSPQEIRDVSDLPAPKETIAAALIDAYTRDDAHPFSPYQIRGWLLALAQFQRNVGKPILDPAAETARRMTAAADSSQTLDTQALSTEIEEQGHAQHWVSRRTHLQPQVEAERRQLIERLEAAR